MEDTFYRGKVFIVTGASSGIGRAVVLALIEAGAKVLGVARRENLLMELQKNLSESVFQYLALDITEKDAAAIIVKRSVQVFQKLDGVIYSSGITMRGNFSDTKSEVFRRVMNVNYFGMVSLFQASLDQLKRSEGSLVSISSIQGEVALPERAAYSASKHATQGFMDSIRIELNDQAIHVMNVSPGYVKTNLSKAALTANGDLYQKADPAHILGLLPETVASEILNGIRLKKSRIYPAGFKERAARLIGKFSPTLLDSILLNRYRNRY